MRLVPLLVPLVVRYGSLVVLASHGSMLGMMIGVRDDWRLGQGRAGNLQSRWAQPRECALLPAEPHLQADGHKALAGPHGRLTYSGGTRGHFHTAAIVHDEDHALGHGGGIIAASAPGCFR